MLVNFINSSISARSNSTIVIVSRKNILQIHAAAAARRRIYTDEYTESVDENATKHARFEYDRLPSSLPTTDRLSTLHTFSFAFEATSAKIRFENRFCYFASNATIVVTNRSLRRIASTRSNSIKKNNIDVRVSFLLAYTSSASPTVRYERNTGSHHNLNGAL